MKFAGTLAAETGAGLTLYTVVAPRAEIFAPIVGRDAEEAFMATVREDARAALDKALTELPDGVDAGEELLEGNAVDALAALDEHETDLLVCGSRGYGPCGACCSAACCGGSSAVPPVRRRGPARSWRRRAPPPLLGATSHHQAG